jgi:excinuclease ABC subunit A
VRVNNLKDLDVEVPRNKLVVVTGVSGAGKSSLVIDTICAEGQRVYLESLNPYSRQFVGKMSNPDVDFAIGIPPTISVKKTANSQRWSSTVGTVTEIYNYLRLVFAKIGVAECDRCGRKMRSVTPGRIADELEKKYNGELALITFRASGSGTASVVERLVREGFTRVMVDGAVVRLEDIGDSTKALQSELYVVVDRLAPGQCARKRLVDSLEIAYREGDGELQVHISGGPILRYSARADCPYCGTEPVNLSPALFSFNSAAGWCPRCHGSGTVAAVDLQAVVPDDRKSIEDGAIAPWQHPQYRWPLNELRVIAHKYGLSLHTVHRRLSRKHKKLILEGETYFPGVYRFFDMLERKKHKPGVTEFLDMYRKNVQCPDCGGGRLNRQALSVKVDGYNIAGLCAEPLSGLRKRLARLALDSRERTIAGGAIEQAVRRVDFLIEMGLGYLMLDRSFSTLSEGEIQRINLAGFLAADLAGSLYALDEPTVGLHPWDRTRLLSALQALKERGNTVVVIEHDPNMLARADQIIELGPGAGQDGGEVVFQGSYDQMVACKRSRTGSHLSGRVTMPPRGRRSATGYLRIVKANKHNLRNVDVRIPLGMLVCITGVSGSGKTVLLRDVLFAALDGEADMLPPERRGYVAVEGGDLFEQVIFAEHGSMSRSPRPIVASYVGFYASIRTLLSDVPLARFRGYRSNHFSFNAKVGRCPGCNGLGHVEVGMSLLPDVRIVCPACEGKRFKEEVLKVRLGGKNIADVLSMSVDEATEFFQDSPRIVPGLRVLKDVGLGYVQLGQPLATLSRGETQRLKLAACMVKGAGGSTLFLFDEPTAGLHFEDVKDLIECFNNLIGRGASVVVAEHNLELVRYADYVIDLGPGAGRRGGRVVARGTPEHIARCKSSKTGAALEAYRNGAVRPPGAGARSPKNVRT